MAMRPLAAKQEPSLVAKAVGVALSPVLYSIQLGSALLGWAYTNLASSMQLPMRLVTAMLQITDAVICDMLAFLSREPGLRSQVQACQETISSLQLTKQAQERQIALLETELDNLKAEKGKTQRKNLELNKQLQRLQRRLSRTSVEQGAAGSGDTSAAPPGTADAALKQAAEDMDLAQQQHAVGEASCTGAGWQQQGYGASKAYAAAGSIEYGQLPARGWYLHACVVMASLGVRWWLLNQTDPLQRKVMLVIIWPAVWVYGGLLTKTFPNSYTLRASLACTCWALLGYVAHEMVAVSVRGRQQGIVPGL